MQNLINRLANPNWISVPVICLIALGLVLIADYPIIIDLLK